MPLQVENYLIEVVEGKASTLHLSHLRLRNVGDEPFQEDESDGSQIFDRFPPELYQIEYWAIANGGEPYVDLDARFAPEERSPKANTLGRCIPVPTSVIGDRLVGSPEQVQNEKLTKRI